MEEFQLLRRATIWWGRRGTDPQFYELGLDGLDLAALSVWAKEQAASPEAALAALTWSQPAVYGQELMELVSLGTSSPELTGIQRLGFAENLREGSVRLDSHALADPNQTLGLRPDAIWHVPVLGTVDWIAPDGTSFGWGWGVCLIARDLLGDMRQAVGFYHSAAWSPLLTVAHEISHASALLSIERYGYTVWEVEVDIDRSRRVDPAMVVEGWTTRWQPGDLAIPDSLALEAGDCIRVRESGGFTWTHPVQILHPSWAPVKPAASRPWVRVHPRDGVAVILSPIKAGTALQIDGQSLVARQAIPFGHKIALTQMAPGQPIVKYGEIIGEATAPIEPGDHVHVHNFDSRRGRGDLQATES